MKRITAKSRVATKEGKEAILDSQRKEKEAAVVRILVLEGPS